MATLDDTTWPRFDGRRTLLVAGALGVIGLVLAGIAIAIAPERALLGYLAAYVTVAVTAIGGLILLLIGYVANARWLAPLRRLQEAISIVFPVLAVLFVPIALGLDDLYVWADPPPDLTAHDRHLLHAKSGYLNSTAFVIRSALYLAVFVITAELLRRWSRRRDGTVPGLDGEHELRRFRMFAAGMLPAVGLAVTFAAFDWVMSLQPTWFSSMFGVYVFAGGFGAGLAVLAILAWRLHASTTAPATTPTTAPLTGHHFHALGRLLFAFVVFWAYTSYFQGFLIQIANRPIEVTFYLVRLRGGWDAVLWAQLIAHFALPFLLLLPRRLKHRPRYLVSVAAIVLLGHVLDIYWLVIPSNGEPLWVHWADVPALVGIAGACVAFAAWRQRGVALVPTGDPFLPAGRRYESPT